MYLHFLIIKRRETKLLAKIRLKKEGRKYVLSRVHSPSVPGLYRCGRRSVQKGETHVRRVFPVFDLLYVKEGVLYITEDENAFSVEAGEYILLSPGLEHYGTKGSEETTSYSWLHFEGADYEMTETTGNNWSELRRKKGALKSRPATQLSLPQKGR